MDRSKKHMLDNVFIKLGFFVIVLLLVVCILWLHRVSSRNKFENIKSDSKKDKIDPTKDGKMIFDYLINPNYDKEVLNKYYLNDDKIINGYKLANHYYQPKRNNFWGFLYNYPESRIINGVLIKSPISIPNLNTVEKSDSIYNNYKVRL